MPDTQQKESSVDEKIKNLFRITTDRMYTAIESFSVWKRMNQMININEVGKDQAERNVEILKRYWGFFHPVLFSTYKSFVTDLCIFFDSQKFEETFSLNKLVAEIKEKVGDLEYKELIDKINLIKKEHGIKIAFILELRNTEVSHQEMDRKSRPIIYKDIEELFLGVQEILNVLSKYYNDSFTMWDHVERESVNSLEWVVDNLERGEKVRLDEINKDLDKYRI